MSQTLIEEKIHKELRSLDKKLQKKAVYEDGELDYFEDEAADVFDETQEKIGEFLFKYVSVIIKEELPLKSLPKIVVSRDIHEFNNAISHSDDEYGLIEEYAGTLDITLVNWEPLYLAIRRYFDLERISNITGKQEFAVAFAGYKNLENVYHEYLGIIQKNELRPAINALISSTFISTQERKELEAVLLLCA
jgi:hypothetical protein